jgi:hypothetical protein
VEGHVAHAAGLGLAQIGARGEAATGAPARTRRSLGAMIRSISG